MDLFSPIVPDDLLHPNFKRIVQSGRHEPEIRTIRRWADGFVDRDGKFAREFQTTFNSSFWELYLFACFKELGLEVDLSKSAPDFCITSPMEMIAEATIASNPDGYRPEWDKGLTWKDLESPDVETIVRFASIRLANSITSKHQKYKKSYAKLEHVKGKPFVICVAPFEQPMFFIQSDRALRRVLYGIDVPIYVKAPWMDERQVVGEVHSSSVEKDNGANIPLGLFTTPDMKEVSAVIFSNTATFCKVRALSQRQSDELLFVASRYNDFGENSTRIVAKSGDYGETLLDGMHIYLNPFAEQPFELGPFEGAEITIHQLEPRSSDYLVQTVDGFLLERFCISTIQDRKIIDLCKPIPNTNYLAPKKPEIIDGRLFSIEGVMGPYVDNHMAYHRGWTIIVAMDSIDSDWGGQAIPGTFRDLQSYINANADSGGEKMLITREFQNTKEEALAEILKLIDKELD